MNIGIIGAMPQEVAWFQHQLKELKVWEQVGRQFYSGQLGNHHVIVVQSGIGKVSAAMIATLLIQQYHVDCLINTGSAGGIGEGLHIEDIIISERVAYHDVDVTAFGYAYGQMAGMPKDYQADHKLLDVAYVTAKQHFNDAHVGLIVSGDQFVHDQQHVARILEHFPEALANEMEATAIGQVAYQYQVPFVVIRVLSDTADEQAHLNFDEFIEQVGEKSAKMVAALIEQLPEDSLCEV